MEKKLPKTYNPFEIEDEIYQDWEKSGYFNPDNLPEAKLRKPFVIAMPPPNITGDLHLGHATGLTIQDILIRFKRMQGYAALWIPGTDHAGIATQVVVEKLIAQEGLDRYSLGRERFLKRIWAWKKEYGDKIVRQIRKLGASCDWSREHFTMDPDLTEAVQEAFIRLYKAGLIYKGKRIINWCPRCQTALSDLEVEYKEYEGKLWYIRYPFVKNPKKFISVATTRPETMLGDTAVAVHPQDKRYKKLIGEKVIVPLVNREVPIIADKEVDPKFGTGAVKVTPAHDPVDFEISVRHKLPAIQVIDYHNQMTPLAGEFAKLSPLKARLKIIEKLEELKLKEKEEVYQFRRAHCSRCQEVIEPLISEQWFLRMDEIVKPAIRVVERKKIKIIPERFTKIYLKWLKEIKDWCLSRQLWWGHAIPVWYCQKCKKEIASKKKPLKCPKCKGKEFKADPNTLDTWFSSALWTFSTLGWPKKIKETAGKIKKLGDLARFHPTDIMETAWDILFFWVARMIIMSLYFLKEIPFHTVYLHGLVLDKQGKKMSKSKGTGLDPLVMIDKYGTDALRLSLVLGTAPGQDFKFYEEKVKGFRNYTNKLWNIGRFILNQLDKEVKPPSLSEIKKEELTLADRWILSQIQRLIKKVSSDLENLHFSEAGQTLYEFTWHKLADWYLEIIKFYPVPPKKILLFLWTNILKLHHPFIPFITEALWQKTFSSRKLTRFLMISKWPQLERKFIDRSSERRFELIQEIVNKIRNLKSQHKVALSKKIPVVIKGQKSLTQKEIDLIQNLAKVKIDSEKKLKKQIGKKTLEIYLKGLVIIVPIAYLFDIQKEIDRLKKEKKKIEGILKILSKKIKNRAFLKKAPPKVIKTQKNKIKELKEKMTKIETSLKELEKIKTK